MLNRLMGNAIKIMPLKKELSQQTIGILIGATQPRRIRPCEIMGITAYRDQSKRFNVTADYGLSCQIR